jgi:ketosteroid isomerase-like protein
LNQSFVQEVTSLDPIEAKKTIRNILEAFNRKDITTMLSYYTDDVTFIRSEGTFKGKEEIKKYYTWAFSNWEKLTLIEKDIIVEGDKAVLEFVQEGTSLRRIGKRLSLLCLDLFVFKEGKVQEVHICHDRLLIAKQLSDGWFENTVVNGVINTLEKGLH